MQGWARTGDGRWAQQSDEPAFENLIRYIQQSRGVDFRGYKRTSLRRRISLRMEHQHVDTFTDYHSFLEAHPQEFVDLLNTVLINVTWFFRDPDAWDGLREAVLPRLVKPGRGLGLAREVQQRQLDMPVILTSGYGGTMTRLSTMNLPFLRKPYQLNALSQAIEAAISTRCTMEWVG